MSLRTVDLARLGGVSTQQVRNYVDQGVLPPAGRTPAGYRTFEEYHRSALLTYRALTRGHGWVAAREILHAVHRGDRAHALAIVDERHAVLHEQRQALAVTAEALEAVADEKPGPAPRGELLVGELARRLGVRPSALRVWEAEGLLTPVRDRVTGYRHYASADVRDARMILLLRQSRYRLAQIRPVLADLRRTGSRTALRAAITQRREDLTRRATAMLAGDARLHDYLGEYLSEAPPES